MDGFHGVIQSTWRVRLEESLVVGSCVDFENKLKISFFLVRSFEKVVCAFLCLRNRFGKTEAAEKMPFGTCCKGLGKQKRS